MNSENERDAKTISMRGATFMLGGGILLILLGLVFQIGEFGYGRSLAQDFWFFSMLLTNLWNMLAVPMNVPGPRQVTRFWPLLLVGMGLAIVMLRRNMAAPLQQGDSHDE